MKLTDVNGEYTGRARGWFGDSSIVELSMNRMKKLGADRCSHQKKRSDTQSHGFQNMESNVQNIRLI